MFLSLIKKDQPYVRDGVLSIVVGQAGAFLQCDDVHPVGLDGRDGLIRMPARLLVEIGASLADAAAPCIQRKEIFARISTFDLCQQFPEDDCMGFGCREHSSPVEVAVQTMNRLE